MVTRQPVDLLALARDVVVELLPLAGQGHADGADDTAAHAHAVAAAEADIIHLNNSAKALLPTTWIRSIR